MISHRLSSLPRCIGMMLLSLVSLAWSAPLHAASIDPSVIENPHNVVLDRASNNRWQALFEQNPHWVARQIAYLETHQPDLLLSLLTSRLLYRGDPWQRRLSDTSNSLLWKRTNIEVRSAILRTLRSHRDPILGDYLCQYLVYEDDAGLVASALVDLWLIDPLSGPTWAIRLADPRGPLHLPGSSKASVRERCLSFLVQTSGIDSPESRQALEWALMHVTGTERNHVISLIPAGTQQDLLIPAVLRLFAEFKQGILDDEEQFGLVLATTRLTGVADHDLVVALMNLAVHANRAVAAAAATALATSLQWDVAVAVNDLALRAQLDPDPAVRNSLLAFLVRLYPSAVIGAAGPHSPWTDLANHHQRLQAWEDERGGH